MSRGTVWGVASTAIAAIALSGLSANAAEVTLRMKGGDFSVSGDLKAFDGAKYTIVSKSFGSMSLDANRFDCEGANCPRAGQTVALAQSGGAVGTIALAGSNTIGGQLMPALVQAYAQAQGLKTTRVAGSAAEELVLKIVDQRGTEVGAVDLKRHGSGTSFKALAAKAADIGMSSRQIKADEAQTLAAAGLGNMRARRTNMFLGSTVWLFWWPVQIRQCRYRSIRSPRYFRARSQTGPRSAYRRPRSRSTHRQPTTARSIRSTTLF